MRLFAIITSLVCLAAPLNAQVKKAPAAKGKKQPTPTAQPAKPAETEEKNIDEVIREKKADIPKVEDTSGQKSNQFVTTLVHAAQINAVDLTDINGLHLEGGLAYLQYNTEETISTSSASANQKINVAGPGLYGIVAYGSRTMPAKFSAEFTKINANGKESDKAISGGETSSKYDLQLDTMTFQAAFYPTAQFELGLAYHVDYTRLEIKPDSGDSFVGSYTYSRPGIVLGYHTNEMKIRFGYLTKVDRSSSDHPGLVDPSEIEIEGKFKISPTFSWHGLINQTRYSEKNYDNDSGKESDRKDALRLYTGPSMVLSQNMGFDFDLGYHPETAKPDARVSSEHVSTFSLIPRLYVGIAPMTTLAGQLAYESGSRSVAMKSSSGVEYTDKLSMTDIGLSFSLAHRM